MGTHSPIIRFLSPSAGNGDLSGPSIFPKKFSNRIRKKGAGRPPKIAEKSGPVSGGLLRKNHACAKKE